MADHNAGNRSQTVSLGADARSILEGLSTATITTVLLKRGLRNAWIRGVRPLDPGYPRIVGPAFTMRFVPAREDLATPESLSSPGSTRGAVEAMPEGAIAVVDSMGITNVGILGDILCARMHKRGVAALVTDGAVRDVRGIRETRLPIWCNGVAAPPSVAGLTFVGWQEPVGCGGVAIFPDDIIVVDEDGAIVIPATLLEHVVEIGPETEMLDSWVLNEVGLGRKLPGLYPPDVDTTAEYEAWRENGKPKSRG